MASMSDALQRQPEKMGSSHNGALQNDVRRWDLLTIVICKWLGEKMRSSHDDALQDEKMGSSHNGALGKLGEKMRSSHETLLQIKELVPESSKTQKGKVSKEKPKKQSHEPKREIFEAKTVKSTKVKSTGHPEDTGHPEECYHYDYLGCNKSNYKNFFGKDISFDSMYPNFMIDINLSMHDSASWVLDTGCGSHICANPDKK